MTWKASVTNVVISQPGPAPPKIKMKRILQAPIFFLWPRQRPRSRNITTAHLPRTRKSNSVGYGMHTESLHLPHPGIISRRLVQGGVRLRIHPGVHLLLRRSYTRPKIGFWRMDLIIHNLGDQLQMLIWRKGASGSLRLGGECGGQEYCIQSSEIQ